MLDYNASGYAFDSVGAIEIKEGTCNIKYTLIKKYKKDNGYQDYYEDVYGHTGFAGNNKEDNGEFYIELAIGALGNVTYKCDFSDDKILCKLLSKYNLSGCHEEDLELIKSDSNNIDLVYNQKLEEEKERRKKEEERRIEEEKEAFIENCQNYTFEQIARNPINFKGTNVKLTGEVIQVMTDNNSTNLRVNITKKGTYSTYYTDTIYVVYYPQNGEDKILEKDIITIYGISQGDCSYTTVLGSTVTLPNILAKYITIEK